MSAANEGVRKLVLQQTQYITCTEEFFDFIKCNEGGIIA